MKKLLHILLLIPMLLLFLLWLATFPVVIISLAINGMDTEYAFWIEHLFNRWEIKLAKL